MADTSLTATYTTQRRTADRDELLRWRQETLAEPPAAAPAAPAAPATPEKPPGGRVADAQIVKAGASAFWDTFQAGATNIADAIYAKAPQGVGTKIGQGVLGALQMAGSLGSGVGAVVRESIKQYSPGMESSVAIPGGTNSPAGFLRTMMAAPGLLFDPKMKQADPQALAAGLNEPMTYGELIDVLTQFAVPAVGVGTAARAAKARFGGAAEAPPVARGVEQPAGPVRPLELPAGPEGPLALPERGTGPLVTPPPEGTTAGVPMTPGEVAIELRTVLERIPKPEPARPGVRPYQDPATLIEGPTPEVPTGLVDAQGRPVAAPVVEALAERDRLRAFERTPLDQPARTAKPPEEPTGIVGTPGAAGPPEFLKAQPHVWREGSTAASRAQEFDALPPESEVWVFHATDAATAADMAAHGVDPAKKPVSLGRQRFEAGEGEARFGPGAGLGGGLYVGSDPFNVEGFGRQILAIRVRKSDLAVSPEQATLGERSLGTALALSDAQIPNRIPADSIRVLSGADVHRLTAFGASRRATTAEAPTGDLGTALDVTMKKMGMVIRQELDAADVAEVVAKAAPEEVGRAAPEGVAAAVTPEAAPTPEGVAPTAAEGGPISRFKASTVVEDHLLEITRTLQRARQGEPFVIKVGHDGTWRGVGKPEAPKMDAPPPDFYEIKIAGGRSTIKETVTQRMRDWVRGEGGGADPALLARMAVGAAAGGAVGDTPEERIAGALLGMGLGAAVTKRLAARLAETYKASGLADETGAIDFSKFRARPAVQATEQPFQPNYKRLALTPELKRFSVNLHRMMKDEILERRGGVKTEEATVTAAKELLADGKMTAERLLNLEEQAVLSREEITAARMIGQRSRDYSAKLNDAFKAGQVSGEEFMDAFAVAAAISKNVRVAQTRIAQAQQASHIKVGVEHPSAFRADDVIHLADDLAKNATPEQLSKALDSIETPATRQKATELAAVLPRAFLEVMYFSYLSGKATLRNAIGGLVMPPIAMLDMAIAPYMPRWGKKAQTERVLPGTATQMFTAYQESMLDMFQMLKFWDPEARARLRGLEEEVSGGRQLESRYAPAFTSENMPVLGPAADMLGTVFRLPGHILGTTDAMAKMVNARMWQRFEAFHQATREGHGGPELATRIDKLMDDPTLLSDLSRERIQDFQERQTFTKDMEGSILGPLQRGPENPWLNAAYRWQVLPFFRTPARALETGLLHTPVLNMTMTKFWQDMAAGGRTQQIAQAKLVFGTAVMGTFAYLESQGMVTGDGPDDPKLRKQWQDELGWQPRSWWDPVAGKWRSYDGVAPLSDWIGAAADMSTAARRTPGDLGAMALAAGLGMATAFDTKAYTQTLSDLFSFMRPGTSDDTIVERGIALIFKRLQGVANPGILRELETVGDPAIRRARPSGAYDHVITRELDVLKRNWMSQIPGLSSLKDAEGFYVTPPDRDRIDGVPTMIETAPLVPFASRTPKADPLKAHIFGDLQGAGFGAWPEWIGGGRPTADVGIGTREAENVTTGARMTPQEKDIYVRLFTQEVKDGQGLTYRQALEAAIANPLYQAQSTIGASGTPRDGGKARWLHRIDAQFHELTEAALRARAPALDREVKRKEQERVIRKAPTAEQPNVRQLLQGLTR